MGGFTSKRPPRRRALEHILLGYHESCITHIGAGDPPLRKENQDVYSTALYYGPDELFHVFFLLDGHGEHGRVLADFCLESLRRTVLNLLLEKNADPQKAITTAFATCANEIKSADSIGFRSRLSGTTATVVIVYDYTLHIGFVGDSKVAMIKRNAWGKYKAVALTREHRLSEPDERSRIESAGGVIATYPNRKTPAGPERLWLSQECMAQLSLKTPLPGLMISRSLGDDLARMCGVTSDPEVLSVEITDMDVGFILASDGLWDVVSLEECANAVYEATSLCHGGTQKLLDLALEGWTQKQLADNITIVACLFPC